MAGGGIPDDPRVRKARAARSGAVQRYGRDHPESVEAGRNLAALMLEKRITEVLTEAPPLTDEQRTRLAELLAPVRRDAQST